MTECHYVQETCAQERRCELRGNRFNKACDLIDIVKHVWELGVGIPTASLQRHGIIIEKVRPDVESEKGGRSVGPDICCQPRRVQSQ